MVHVKVGLSIVLVLIGNWASSDARPATHSHLSEGKVDVCSLCEEYASLGVEFLSQNKTQKEIVEALHYSCGLEFQSLIIKRECIKLVDHFSALFFTRLSSVQPDEICKKANLCNQKAALSMMEKQNRCDVCHHAVDDIIVQLKDPDTQLEILKILLKGCNSMENYVKKCKALVFEYGPLIIANAERYLEKTDVCVAVFHACKTATASSEPEQLDDSKIVMVTSS